jgi:hypothetical protein
MAYHRIFSLIVEMKMEKIKSERKLRKTIHKQIKVEDDWPESYNEWLIY